MQFEEMRQVYSEEQITLSNQAPKDLSQKTQQPAYEIPKTARIMTVGIIIIMAIFIYLGLQFQSTRIQMRGGIDEIRERMERMNATVDRIKRRAEKLVKNNRYPNQTLEQWPNLKEKIEQFYNKANPADPSPQLLPEAQQNNLFTFQQQYYNNHRLLDLLDNSAKEIIIDKRNRRFKDISSYTPEFKPPQIQGPWNSTHNNFHSPYIDTVEKRYIQRAIDAQHARLNERYRIDYVDKQDKICVVVSTQNNGQGYRYLFNLGSILSQKYENYRLVIVDQGSTDKTGERIKAHMYQLGYRPDQYVYYRGEDQSLGLKYFYWAVKEHCLQGQIVVPVYGSDELVNPWTFKVINSVYKERKVGMAFSQYFEGSPKTDIYAPVRVDPATAAAITSQKYQQAHRMFGHLVTFKAELFHSIAETRLKFQNGTWISPIYPQSWILPLYERACNRHTIIDEYQYLAFYGTNNHHPTWSYSGRKFQVLEYIRKMDRYDCLEKYRDKKEGGN